MYKKALTLLAFAGLLYISSTAQQLKTPAASPPQFVKQDFGISSIELSYSRPGMRHRQIFGDLVPYGKVWRTGANQATTLNFGDDVTIGGTRIPAGKYGLLTIPGPDEWTFIITRQLDVTNPSAYKADQDVVRVSVKPQELPFPIETFTILFSNMSAASCDLVLLWDRTAVMLPIKTEVDAKVMAQIDNALQKKDSFPYFSAGVYYLENGKDLNKALEWLSKATDQSPDAYYMFYQKAKCQAKLGKKQEAIATAKQSIALATKAGNGDYVALNEKLIAGLK